MKIYLAGANEKTRIISALRRGYKDIRIYLAGGGVTGNLNPSWKKMAKTEITPNRFIKGLIDENFLCGEESRHWIQDVTSPIKENEDIYGRKHDIPSLYRSDIIQGGGLARQYISIDHIYLNPSTTPMKTRKDCSHTSGISCLTVAHSHSCKKRRTITLTGKNISRDMQTS